MWGGSRSRCESGRMVGRVLQGHSLRNSMRFEKKLASKHPDLRLIKKSIEGEALDGLGANTMEKEVGGGGWRWLQRQNSKSVESTLRDPRP